MRIYGTFTTEKFNFARPAHFLEGFFAVTARLQRAIFLSRDVKSWEDVNTPRRIFLSPSKLQFGLHKFRKKLIRHSANSSYVIMSVIPMTSLFYKELILERKI